MGTTFLHRAKREIFFTEPLGKGEKHQWLPIHIDRFNQWDFIKIRARDIGGQTSYHHGGNRKTTWWHLEA
jgi:hypothetical protein